MCPKTYIQKNDPRDFPIHDRLSRNNRSLSEQETIIPSQRRVTDFNTGRNKRSYLYDPRDFPIHDRLFRNNRRLLEQEMIIPSQRRVTDLNTVFEGLTDNAVLMGDLNTHHPLWDEAPPNRRGNLIADFVTFNDYVILNDGSPTFFQPPQSPVSAVDITIVSNNIAQMLNWEVLDDCGKSDHFPTLVKFKDRSCSKLGHKVISYTYRNFGRADRNKFYGTVVADISINGQDLRFVKLNNIINKAADLSIPMVVKFSSGKIYNPCWDHDCSEIINRSKECIKNFKLNPTLENYIQAKSNIALAKKQLNSQKRSKFIEFCECLNRKSNISYVWEKINRFKGKKVSCKLHNIDDSLREGILNKMAICNMEPKFMLKIPMEHI
ncbi:uncharacterized protein LOC132706844 isoform X2 [Cylas formicarius]|nr:uncharacterized protein LOC132706844 isoform X2 [Cylas formicarius]